MSRRLRTRLLTIGRAAGIKSESGGIRFFALVLASLSLALTLSAVVAAIAGEVARESRMSEGQLIPAAEPASAEPKTLVKMAIDHLREGRQYTVVFLSPGSEDAPLPPGLDQWPQPGTAVVSPELLREGAEQNISGRYGEIVGTIARPGLADATELLVYVRPAHDLAVTTDPDVVEVSSFGGSGPPAPFQNVHWLLADQDFFDGMLVWLLVVLGVVPSLLLGLVASKVASYPRDRRDALVTALGGRTPHRLWVSVGEAWIPASLGMLASIVVMAWFLAADRRLPLVDYVVPASDLRGLWWLFGLCAVSAAAFVLCAAVLQSAIGTFSLAGNRPRRKLSKRTRKVWAALFPCFVILAAVVPYWLPDGLAARSLAGYIGLLGMVLTMPTVISVGVAAMGRGFARWGHRRYRPALLTAGARMASSPEAVARQVFGVCACIVFLLFALTWQRNFANTSVEAEAFVDENGYSLVEVRPRSGGQISSREVSDFVAALPDNIEVVAYSQAIHEGNDPTAPDTQIQLTGTCQALESQALPCPAEGQVEQVEAPEGALAEWLDWTVRGGEPVLTVVSGAPSSAEINESLSLLAFTTDGDDIAAGVLQSAGVAFPFGVVTNVPGESWRTGSVPPLEQSGWIVLLGGFGIVVLTLATGLGLAGEFLRFGRAIAPLSVLAGNRRIYWYAAALVSLLPLTMAVAAGITIGYPAVQPMAVTDTNLISPAILAIIAAVTLTAGMIMWWWSAVVAVNSAERWRPGRGDD